jgi:hypothetical protein
MNEKKVRVGRFQFAYEIPTMEYKNLNAVDDDEEAKVANAKGWKDHCTKRNM